MVDITNSSDTINVYGREEHALTYSGWKGFGVFFRLTY